jgi:hypothetical protein
VDHQIVGRFLEVSGYHLVYDGLTLAKLWRRSVGGAQVETEKLTFKVGDQLDHIAYANVDHTQEALVLLFELLLVKHLNREDAVFIHTAIDCQQMTLPQSAISR